MITTRQLIGLFISVMLLMFAVAAAVMTAKVAWTSDSDSYLGDMVRWGFLALLAYIIEQLVAAPLVGPRRGVR